MVCIKDRFCNFFAVRLKKKTFALAEKTNRILIMELLWFAHDWEADQALAGAEISDFTVYC